MVSVGSLLNGGFSLLRSQPKAVAMWGGVYIALMAVMLLAMRPFMASMVAMQQAQLARTAGGPPVIPQLPQGLGLLFLIYVLLLFVIAAIFAAAVRAASRGGDDAAGFLRFGMDELRLIGLGIIFVVGLFIAEIAVIAVFALAVGVGTLAGPVVAGVLGFILGLAALCALVWVQVRLSLTGAITVLRHKIIIGDAWRATRGHFWTLFGTFLILTIAYLIVSLIIVGMTNPALLSVYAGGMKPADAVAAMQAQSSAMANGISVVTIAQYVVSSIIATLFFAVTFGTIATAAVELSGGSRVASIFE